MSQQISIYLDDFGYRIIFNGVTIAFNNELMVGADRSMPNIRIEDGHPDGPVLCYYGLRVVISPKDAENLKNIGVQIF